MPAVHSDRPMIRTASAIALSAARGAVDFEQRCRLEGDRRNHAGCGEHDLSPQQPRKQATNEVEPALERVAGPASGRAECARTEQHHQPQKQDESGADDDHRRKVIAKVRDPQGPVEPVQLGGRGAVGGRTGIDHPAIVIANGERCR